MRVIQAVSPEEMEAARGLFLEYAKSLGFDLSFQNFKNELAGLPGDYGPPRGRLFLADVGGNKMGCAALRPLEPEICEMKRLYVVPDYRGRGIGRALAGAVVNAGQEIGYARMRLDTLDSMIAAMTLYRSLGFEEIPPYRFNPLAGAKYFELRLHLRSPAP